MKKKLTSFLFFSGFVFLVAAQEPVLHWQFSNAQLIPGDTLSFDVELKCSQPGTYHSSTQVYFDYNPSAFGDSIVAENRVIWSPLELLEGDVAGTPKYTVVNCIDNTSSRLAILMEANFVIPNPLFMNEVTSEWKGMLNFRIKVMNVYEPVNIVFVPEDGGIGLMNGGEYYVDASHPNETKYGEPPAYAGVYENDLMNLILFPDGWLSGIVTDAMTGLPVQSVTITAGIYTTSTEPGGSYLLQVPPGEYTLTAQKSGYVSQTLNGVIVTQADTTLLDISLNPLTGTLEGIVFENVGNNPVQGAIIDLDGIYQTLSEPGGTFNIPDVLPGLYDITVTYNGYYPYNSGGIEIVADSTTHITVFLSPLEPVLHWRFTNVQILAGDSISFDVNLKCNLPGTFHSKTKIYFDYNENVFGDSIVKNNRISWSQLELLEGGLSGSPAYSVVGFSDETNDRLAINVEASNVVPDPAYMYEVDTVWKGYMRFRIKLQDLYQPVMIAFVGQEGGIGYMDGNQLYVDLLHPLETLYGVPPEHEGIYENELMNYFPIPSGWVKGTVTDAFSGASLEGASIVADTFATTSMAGGNYILQLPLGTYTISAGAYGYYPQTIPGVIILEQDTTNLDFSLMSIPGSIEGYVLVETGNNPIDGALINLGGLYQGYSGPDGYFNITGIPAGMYDLTVTHPGFYPYTSGGIMIEPDSVTQKTVYLESENPIAYWRFANIEFLQGDSLSFDVEFRSCQPGTFLSDMQIYFNYNNASFGSNIVANNKVIWNKLEILGGDVAGSPKYNIVNCVDNSSSRLAILAEANFLVPNPVFMNEVDTIWKGMLNFRIKVMNIYEPVNVEFVAKEGTIGIMDGGQYYIDATHPMQTKYGNPPGYEGIYENDLMNYYPVLPGVLEGTVTNGISGNPLSNVVVSSGSYSTTTLTDGTYSLNLPGGVYDITASKFGYADTTYTNIVLINGDTTLLDIAMLPATAALEGYVRDVVSGAPIPGATVDVEGLYQATSGADGYYFIGNIEAGIYDVSASATGYVPLTLYDVAISANPTPLDIYLHWNVSYGPDIYWRFANPVVYDDMGVCKLEFDVEVSCDEQGTFHSTLNLLFDYNSIAFGENIIFNNMLEYERLELLQGDLAGTPLYEISVVNDTTPNTCHFGTAATFPIANPMFMNEIPQIPVFEGFMRFKLTIADQNQLAGIFFRDDLMDGRSYYISSTHPTPDQYGAGTYMNDLINQSIMCVSPGMNSWSGLQDEDWFNPANWLMGIVPFNTDVEIPDVSPNPFPVIGASGASVDNLIIYPDASLEIGNTGELTVLGELIKYGTLTIICDTIGSGTLLHNTNGVQAEVQKTYKKDSWHLISSPITNAMSGIYIAMYLQTWSEPTQMWSDIIPMNILLEPLRGYALYTPYGYEVGLPNIYSGPLNNGQVGIPVTAINQWGWNLLGNPYPSCIDWDQVSLPAYLNGAVYYLDGATNNFISYNGGIGGGSRYIPPLQGFFVSTNASGTFTLDNSSRTHQGSENYYKNDMDDLLVIKASGNGYNDRAYLHFDENASQGFDGNYDAYKMFSWFNDALPQIYTLAGDEKLSINVLPATGAVEAGFTALSKGIYTIAIDKNNGFDVVFIEDIMEGLVTDLTQAEYIFNYPVAGEEMELKLYFELPTESSYENGINIYSYGDKVYINNIQSLTGDIRIFDLTGNLLRSEILLPGLNTVKLNVQESYYLVKVTAGKEVCSKVVYIK